MSCLLHFLFPSCPVLSCPNCFAFLRFASLLTFLPSILPYSCPPLPLSCHRLFLPCNCPASLLFGLPSFLPHSFMSFLPLFMSRLLFSNPVSLFLCRSSLFTVLPPSFITHSFQVLPPSFMLYLPHFMSCLPPFMSFLPHFMSCHPLFICSQIVLPPSSQVSSFPAFVLQSFLPIPLSFLCHVLPLSCPVCLPCLRSVLPPSCPTSILPCMPPVLLSFYIVAMPLTWIIISLNVL